MFSSAGSEHLPYKQRVGGSNPSTPTARVAFSSGSFFCSHPTVNYMSRIEKEKRVVGVMVRLYCRKKEGNSELCDSCRQLLAYAESRLEHCPFGERKTSCRRCTVHCYKPSMRQQMREVMRFSGPRMIFYEPLETIRHIFK